MAQVGIAGARATLGGVAVVCCVHDRIKGEVVTEEHVALVSLHAGIIFDPVQHRTHRCGCCRNLFVDSSDEPLYCHTCRRPFVHQLAGPLAPAIGPVDG